MPVSVEHGIVADGGRCAHRGQCRRQGGAVDNGRVRGVGTGQRQSSGQPRPPFLLDIPQPDTARSPPRVLESGLVLRLIYIHTRCLLAGVSAPRACAVPTEVRGGHRISCSRGQGAGSPASGEAAVPSGLVRSSALFPVITQER